MLVAGVRPSLCVQKHFYTMYYFKCDRLNEGILKFDNPSNKTAALHPSELPVYASILIVQHEEVIINGFCHLSVILCLQF